MQLLDITCGCRDTGWDGVHTFDTAVLAQLTALRELTLRGFAEPCLWGIPRTLRVLRILGGHHNEFGHNRVRSARHFFSPPASCRCGTKRAVHGALPAVQTLCFISHADMGCAAPPAALLITRLHACPIPLHACSLDLYEVLGYNSRWDAMLGDELLKVCSCSMFHLG